MTASSGESSIRSSGKIVFASSGAGAHNELANQEGNESKIFLEATDQVLEHLNFYLLSLSIYLYL